MKITPFPEAGVCREHFIIGLDVNEVTERIGFVPNVDDDPYKVGYSWGFKVTGQGFPRDGEICGVWDYKNSHKNKVFSAYGSKAALEAVFGAEHVE